MSRSLGQLGSFRDQNKITEIGILLDDKLKTYISDIKEVTYMNTNTLTITNIYNDLPIETIKTLIINLLYMSYTKYIIEHDETLTTLYEPYLLDYTDKINQLIIDDQTMINYIISIVLTYNLTNLTDYFINIYNRLYLSQYIDQNLNLNVQNLIDYNSANRHEYVTNTLIKTNMLNFNPLGWLDIKIDSGFFVAKKKNISDLIKKSNMRALSLSAKSFNSKYLQLILLLQSIPGLVIAGGAIINSLIDRHTTDIDFFMYGDIDIEKTITQFLNYFRTLKSQLKLNYYITRNAITIVDRSLNKVYQLILRRYNTMDEILHGFDLSCSQVLYDGYNFYMTDGAAMSLNNNITLIDPLTWYYSFEKRIKKYFNRGFAYLIPYFKVDSKLDPYTFNYNKNRIQKRSNINESLKLKYLEFRSLAPFNQIDYNSPDLLKIINSIHQYSDLERLIIKIDQFNPNNDYKSLNRIKIINTSLQLPILNSVVVYNKLNYANDDYFESLKLQALHTVNNMAHNIFIQYQEQLKNHFYVTNKFIATSIKVLYPNIEIKVDSDYFTSSQLNYKDKIGIMLYNASGIRKLSEGKFGYLVAKLTADQVKNFKITDQFEVYIDYDEIKEYQGFRTIGTTFNEIEHFKYLQIEIQDVNSGTTIAYGKDPLRGKSYEEWLGTSEILTDVQYRSRSIRGFARNRGEVDLTELNRSRASL